MGRGMSAVGQVQSSVDDGAADAAVKTIVLLSSSATSLVLFRGEFMRKLAGRGLRVIALAPDFTESERGRIRGFGAEPIDITLERTGLSPLRDLRDLLRLARLYRRLAPDAVIGYFIKPVIYGSIAARLASVPRRFALIAGLGYVFTDSGQPDSWRRKALRLAVSSLYKLALSLCDRVFFLNRDDRDAFVGAGRVDSAKVVLLPSEGIDLDRFSPAPPVSAPMRFLLIARLLREKGLVEFAEAARIVRARHPEAQFRLVGGADPNPGALSPDLVEGWVGDGLLEWTGEIADVRPEIAASSVYVLPSYREGKPVSTQEAMAMARPIVTTDVPGCRDTVEEGVNGFLVPVRDGRALAEAMIRFVDDPALIPRMGAASRRIAERDFDVARINETIAAAMDLDRWATPPAGRPSIAEARLIRERDTSLARMDMAAEGELEKEVVTHRKGYESFTFLMKWAAVTCVVIGFIVILLIRK
jgi:glycosyltransferase involved in cell wall biosynthesis